MRKWGKELDVALIFFLVKDGPIRRIILNIDQFKKESR
jgi:hypothetical protein